MEYNLQALGMQVVLIACFMMIFWTGFNLPVGRSLAISLALATLMIIHIKHTLDIAKLTQSKIVINNYPIHLDSKDKSK